ncbi:MAG: class I SAM-dependent methyltransferase [Elusimicrobiota bacterium]
MSAAPGGACPLCGGARLREAARGAASRVARCEGCAMMFRLPYAAAKDRCEDCRDRCLDDEKCLDAGYSSAFLSARLEVDRVRLERLRAWAGPVRGARVLELGAGVGALASLLAAEAAEYRGLEPSPLFHRALSRSFPALALRVERARFPEGLGAERFDLVVAVDVLPFVEDPVAFLRAARERLAEGGRLYLELPNERLLGLRAAARGALGLYAAEPVHPGHINFFAPATLRAALERAGLRPLRLGQVTLIGDPRRVEMTLRRPLGPLARSGCALLRWSRLDLLLQQGNLVAAAEAA